MGTIDAFQRQVWSPQFKQNCFPHRSKMGVLKSFLRILNPTPLCTFAYLIHREAAAYALASYKPIPAPVDDWLFCPYSDFAKRFPPHRLLSACVTSLGAPSDIGARKARQRLPNSLRVRLLRGIKSGGYRLSMLFRKKRILTFGYE